MTAAEILADPTTSLEAKLAALDTLHRATDDATTHAIARALLVATEDLRGPCLRALRERGAATLYARMLSEPDADRVFAAKVLRFMRDQSAEPALATALLDPDERVRLAAAHTLAVIGAPQSTDALVEALGDPSAQVRFFVVTALAASSDRTRVTAALTARQADETDAAVRSEIDRILRVN